MAIKADDSLSNNHHFYFGKSGFGKSQACRQNKQIPGSGRIIVWDPKGQHKDAGIKCTDLVEFNDRLNQADASGADFKITLTLPMSICTLASHENFCHSVSACLQGDKKTVLIDEELAQVTGQTGGASTWLANLITQGRAYGLEYHGISQEPQTIPKQVLRQARVIWCTQLDHPADYLQKLYGVGFDEFKGLQPMEYLVLDTTAAKRVSKEKLKVVKYK